jgi:hypothetical protein
MAEAGKLILASDLDTTETHRAAAHAIAMIEEDCSKSWPTCPRDGLICDCRLRATRAINSIKLHVEFDVIRPGDQQLKHHARTDIPALVAELRAARATSQLVLDIHSSNSAGWCWECAHPWPCRTVAAYRAVVGEAS